MVAPNRRSGRGSSGSALFSSFHVVLKPRVLSQKRPRKPWQRTFLEFSRGSAHFSGVFTWFCGCGSNRRSGRGSPGRAQKAHWSLRGLLGSQMLILKRNWSTPWRPVEKLIFVAFPGFSQPSCRGSPGSALFLSFHVVLKPRVLSQKWPRKPWQRTFLEFSRGSVAAEAIAEVAAGALAAHFSRVFMWFCGRGSYRRSCHGSPDFLSQKAHWSLRAFLGSKMPILKAK